jgi:tetratricopeptide (TPR) repeat protein
VTGGDGDGAKNDRRMRPLLRKNSLTRVGAAVVLAVALSAGVAAAGDPSAKEASAEMKWGFKAARRGYWQEALMRFKHANELTPNQARILNNIAVAQEANGLYEMALLTYQEGLALEPNNNALRRNYSRFQEFYATYVAPATAAAGEGVEDAQKDG